MRKRKIGFAAGALLACLLYFFENNTGSRIVLGCTLLLPFFPFIRRNLFSPDENGLLPRTRTLTVSAFTNPAEDDAGEPRAYLPGDPVNRIHWKLSAKKDELLVRDPAKEKTEEKARITEEAKEDLPAAARLRKRGFPVLWAILLISGILLPAVPPANQGLQALLNRLYAASEAVNAYAYDHFSVPDGQPVAFAAVLLGVAALSVVGMVLLSRSRPAALCLLAGGVLFQIYFGLAFPAWVNVPVFAWFVIWVMKRPMHRKTVLRVLTVIALVSLAVCVGYPGVDAATEAASEAVRDRLSQIAQSVTGTVREMPAGESETRHVHSQTLITGDGEARPDREYRLVTVDEQPISMPHWVNVLRIAGLLVLMVALLVLPFMPFWWMNRQQKKAMEARKVFASENVSEAVSAIFQHVTAWLEAFGHGGGNLPYAAWNAALSPDYEERFAACEKLFEEATYSSHEMKEEDRQQMLALLEETEQALMRQAGWKQRLRLRYRECLWV